KLVASARVWPFATSLVAPGHKRMEQQAADLQASPRSRRHADPRRSAERRRSAAVRAKYRRRVSGPTRSPVLNAYQELVGVGLTSWRRRVDTDQRTFLRVSLINS